MTEISMSEKALAFTSSCAEVNDFSAIVRGRQNGGSAIFSNAQDCIVTQCL